MEKEGVMPGEHYDGVGPLPGSISETSVAKLPDERMQSAREADQPTQKQKRPVGAGAISLPSRERIGTQPYEHHDGVGPLPGTSSETSVAKLPDERALAAAASSEGRSGAGGGGGTESQKPASDTIVLSENRAPAASAAQKTLNPETGDQNIIPQHPLPAQQVPERVDQGPGVGVSEFNCRESVYVFLARRSQEAPADSKFKEEDVVKEKKSDLERKEEHREGAGEESGSLKQQERTKTMPTSEPQTVDSPRTQRKGRSGRSSSDSDAGNHKKATMMNILKGEMKVLLGRASGNRGRVEEGEKLKQGSY